MRAVLLLALAATIANAASITWTGYGGDNQWTNRINWNPDQVPGPNDDVTIPQGNVFVTIATGVSSLVMGTQVQAPANLTLYQSFVVGNGGMTVQENGNLILNTAQNTVFGQITIGGTLQFIDGIVGGAWTIADRAVADLSNGNEKGFAGCSFTSKGQLTLGGVIVLNQSSSIVLQSNTAASQNLFIQNGDGSGVSFDATAATFTYSTGTLQVQAPVQFGAFVLNSGNVSILDSMSFTQPLNIPANSYVTAAGSANLNISSVTGAGVLTLECKTASLYSMSMTGYVNALGGDIVFYKQADMAVLTIQGGNAVFMTTVYPAQLNLMTGTTSGNGELIASQVLLSTTGLTLGSAVTANKTMTMQSSVLTFGAEGKVTITSGAEAIVTGSVQLTGAPNGKGVVNQGTIKAQAALQSQNIPIAGSGSVTVSKTFEMSQMTLTQSSVTLEAGASISGANSFLTIGAVKSASGGVVQAALGPYNFQCPAECDHVTTPATSAPAQDFRFSA